nr:hypothetical protein [Marinobacterium profundum]
MKDFTFAASIESGTPIGALTGHRGQRFKWLLDALQHAARQYCAGSG